MSIKIISYSDIDAAKAALAEHIPHYTSAPYDQMEWVDSWVSAHNSQYLGMMVIKDDVPYMMYGFEIKSKNGLRLASDIGESHANFHFPIIANTAHNWSPDHTQDFKHELLQLAKLHKIDGFIFDRHLATYNNSENPLCLLSSAMVYEDILFTELSTDFEAFAKEQRGTSGLSRDRRIKRALDKLGEWRCEEIQSPDERAHVVSIFFQQKNEWMKLKGISNIFSDSQAQAFIFNLCAQKNAKNEYITRIYALYLNHQIIATSCNIVNHDHFSNMFHSVDLSITNEANPGFPLMEYAIKIQCESGMRLLDIGAGIARYKQSWLKNTWQVNSFIIPASFIGSTWAIGVYMKKKIITKIKTTPWAWKLAQKIRKLLHQNAAGDE